MPEHRVAALAQGGIADARRHAEALAHRTALLPGPVDPGPAPLDIGAEGILDALKLLVCYVDGFGDLSYFRRSFRRRFDATPSEVRDSAAG